MCGRYTLIADIDEIAERFDAELPSESFASNYNVAPSQKMPVIESVLPKEIRLLDWGIKPIWWQAKPGRHDGIINIRAENFRDKPTFRKDLAERRCLVLSDGFYEWQKVQSGPKVPFRFVLRDSAPFAFAGVWEPLHGEDGGQAFAIITTEPNDLVAKVHDRMPVILEKKDERAWLSEKLDFQDALKLLRPFPAEDMKAYRISTLVNKASNNSPEVIKPVST